MTTVEALKYKSELEADVQKLKPTVKAMTVETFVLFGVAMLFMFVSAIIKNNYLWGLGALVLALHWLWLFRLTTPKAEMEAKKRMIETIHLALNIAPHLVVEDYLEQQKNVSAEGTDHDPS